MQYSTHTLAHLSLEIVRLRFYSNIGTVYCLGYKDALYNHQYVGNQVAGILYILTQLDLIM